MQDRVIAPLKSAAVHAKIYDFRRSLVGHADRRVARALALGQRGQGRRASRTKEKMSS
jgi:hypothetical protein